MNLLRLAVLTEALALLIGVALPVPPTWLLYALVGAAALAVFVALAAIALDH